MSEGFLLTSLTATMKVLSLEDDTTSTVSPQFGKTTGNKLSLKRKRFTDLDSNKSDEPSVRHLKHFMLRNSGSKHYTNGMQLSTVKQPNSNLVDNCGNTLLHYGVQWHLWSDRGGDSMVPHLVQLGVDVDVKNAAGQTPAFHLFHSLYLLFSDLLSKTATHHQQLIVNAEQLRKTVEAGQYSMESLEEKCLKTLKTLKKNGANLLGQCPINSCTLLHYATILGFSNIVLYLVEIGVDLDAEDGKGRTAFDLMERYSLSKGKYLECYA